MAKTLIVVAAFVGVALAAGCGSDGDDPAPQGSVGFAGQAGSTAAGSSGAAGVAGAAVAGSAGAAGSGVAGAAGSGGGGCVDTPKTTLEFLNQCTSSTCAPFDNVARLPLFKDGKLPPVP